MLKGVIFVGWGKVRTGAYLIPSSTVIGPDGPRTHGQLLVATIDTDRFAHRQVLHTVRCCSPRKLSR